MSRLRWRNVPHEAKHRWSQATSRLTIPGDPAALSSYTPHVYIRRILRQSDGPAFGALTNLAQGRPPGARNQLADSGAALSTVVFAAGALLRLRRARPRRHGFSVLIHSCAAT
ncbi:DUF6518 family protein [Streptomyces sp. NPDC048179]|uniref:DUF6518 family protein n=1 Tax=Streptomyces sp. NPDC048179 TaxID=3365506 RepID=UPI00371B0A31